MASLETRIANHVIRLRKSKACQLAKQQRDAYYAALGPSLQLLHGAITPVTQTRGAQYPTEDNRKVTLPIKGALNDGFHKRLDLEGKDKGRQQEEEARSNDPRREEAEALRRGEEVRRREEEEARRRYVEEVRRHEEEEARRRYVEEMRVQEEMEAQRQEMRRQEEARRFEEVRKQEEEARRQYEAAQNSGQSKARNVHAFHPYMNARRNTESEQNNEKRVEDADALNQYVLRWNKLQKYSKGVRTLSFSDIPWPIKSRPSRPTDITKEAVRAFVTTSDLMANPTNFVYWIKKELLRWHPDKFSTSVLPIVYEDQVTQVKVAVDQVSAILTDLMKDARK